MLQNYVLLIFKIYIYQSREGEVINVNDSIKNVTKLRN